MEKGVDKGQIQQISHKFIQQIKELYISKQWQHVDDKPVKCSKMEKQGRVISKGELNINVQFEALAHYFSDPLYMKKQSDKVIKAQVIHKEVDLNVIRIVMQGFAFVSNRELVAVFTFHKEGDKIYVGNRSIDFPCKPEKDTVRAFANVSGNVIERIDQKTSKITNISDLDMNGSIPDFIKKIIATKRAEALIQIEAKIKSNQK